MPRPQRHGRGPDNTVSVESLATQGGYSELVSTLRVVAGRRS
ncbi:protein of unknown function (plasmid) [Cupriavidus taiwanensis]|nr:hypothetical protein CBM2598_U30149 [Cupriavidus taiwanensis]SPD38134.1 protein of unknown function [Cupriavidus taiwanensis]